MASQTAASLAAVATLAAVVGAAAPGVARAAAGVAAWVAAVTSAAADAVPCGWSMGKPEWGKPGWLRGVCELLPLSTTF